MSFGVPLKAGSGSLRLSGTRSSAALSGQTIELLPARKARASGKKSSRSETELVFILRYIRRCRPVFNQTNLPGQARILQKSEIRILKSIEPPLSHFQFGFGAFQAPILSDRLEEMLDRSIFHRFHHVRIGP